MLCSRNEQFMYHNFCEHRCFSAERWLYFKDTLLPNICFCITISLTRPKATIKNIIRGTRLVENGKLFNGHRILVLQEEKFWISVILSRPKGLFKFFCNGQTVSLTQYNNMNILNVITVYTKIVKMINFMLYILTFV